MTDQGRPPAGWYDDPGQPGTKRWWDGTQWGPQAPNATGSPASNSSFAPHPVPVEAVPGEEGATTQVLDQAPRGKGAHDTWLVVLAIAALLFSQVPGLGIVLAAGTAAWAVIRLVRGHQGKKLIAATIIGALAVMAAIGGLGSGGEAEPAAEPAIVTDEEEPAAGADEPSGEPVAEETSTPEPVPSAEPVTEEPAGEYGTYPAAQTQFIEIVQNAAEQYSVVETDLQRSEVVRKRNADICSAVGAEFRDWVGVVHGIGANGDGHAWIEVEIAPSIRINTWNNAFSDIGDDTLIPPGSPMFDRLVAMTEGQKVVVSGRILSDGDSCVKTSNMTEYFTATDPQFIARFSDVAVQ